MPHPFPFDQVMALVSHRADAPPELWAEAMAIAEGLRAPERKAKAAASKEGGEEGEGDAMVVRSDALFGSWEPERLAVGFSWCGVVCVAMSGEKGCGLADTESCTKTTQQELLLRVRLNSHPFQVPLPHGGGPQQQLQPQQQQRVKVLGLFPRYEFAAFFGSCIYQTVTNTPAHPHTPKKRPLGSPAPSTTRAAPPPRSLAGSTRAQAGRGRGQGSSTGARGCGRRCCVVSVIYTWECVPGLSLSVMC